MDFELDNDIRQKVEAAIKAGAPRTEAEKRGLILQAQRVQQQGTTPTPAPTATPTGKGGLMESVGGAALGVGGELARPFKNVGADLFDIAKYILQGEKGFSGQYQNPLRDEKDLVKTRNQQDLAGFGKSVAKDVAGIASYAVPYGKGANFITKAALPGAAQAGLFESGREGATPLSVAGAGVSGAVLAPVLSKLLNLGKTAQSAGGAVRKGVVNPQVADSPFASEAEAEIAGTLQKMGLKGSAEAQRQQVPGVFRKLSGEIQEALAKNPKSIKVSKLVKELRSALDENINYDEGIPLMKKAADKFENQLVSKANQGKGGLSVKAGQLLEYKQNLGKQLSRAFTKVEKGLPLTEKEEVGLALWGKMDDLISGLAPEVKELTKQQSTLYKAAPGLRQSAESKVQVPFIGQFNSLTRPVQRGQDLLGRGLTAVGQGLDTALSPLSSKTGDSFRIPVAISALDQKGKPQQEPGLTNGELPQELKISLPEPEGETGQKISFQQMQKVLLSPQISSKTKDQIKKVYDLQQQSGTADQQKRRGAIQDALNIYDQVASLSLSADSGLTGWSKALVGQLPGVEGGSEEDLKRVTEGFAKAIASAFGKEVGVATDTDIQRWLGLMPKPGDTKEERVRALLRLKQTIEAQMGTAGLK